MKKKVLAAVLLSVSICIAGCGQNANISDTSDANAKEATITTDDNASGQEEADTQNDEEALTEEENVEQSNNDTDSSDNELNEESGEDNNSEEVIETDSEENPEDNSQQNETEGATNSYKVSATSDTSYTINIEVYENCKIVVGYQETFPGEGLAISIEGATGWLNDDFNTYTNEPHLSSEYPDCGVSYCSMTYEMTPGSYTVYAATQVLAEYSTGYVSLQSDTPNAFKVESVSEEALSYEW